MSRTELVYDTRTIPTGKRPIALHPMDRPEAYPTTHPEKPIMAVKTKGVWGIDIGQCALKALRLEVIDGKPTATAFDYVEHPKILSQPDADPDTLIREALEKFLSRNEVKRDDVAIGVAGQSGLARFVKLPPVEEKKIADIVKFEAKQQIPFPLDEVVWDYQKIGGGEVVDGFALETEIGLFAMKRDVITRYLGYFNAVEDRGPHRPDGAAGAGQLRHLRAAQEGRPGARAGRGRRGGAGARRCPARQEALRRRPGHRHRRVEPHHHRRRRRSSGSGRSRSAATTSPAR